MRKHVFILDTRNLFIVEFNEIKNLPRRIGGADLHTIMKKKD